MELPKALWTDDLLVKKLGPGWWEEARHDPPAFPEQLETMTGSSTTELSKLPVDRSLDTGSGWSSTKEGLQNLSLEPNSE